MNMTASAVGMKTTTPTPTVCFEYVSSSGENVHIVPLNRTNLLAHSISTAH